MFDDRDVWEAALMKADAKGSLLCPSKFSFPPGDQIHRWRGELGTFNCTAILPPVIIEDYSNVS